MPVSSYKTDIYTNLIDYGINNSLFELYLKINIKIETIIPLKTSQIDYNTNLLLSSIVIQGEVPYYYYMEINCIEVDCDYMSKCCDLQVGEKALHFEIPPIIYINGVLLTLASHFRFVLTTQ